MMISRFSFYFHCNVRLTYTLTCIYIPTRRISFLFFIPNLFTISISDYVLKDNCGNILPLPRKQAEGWDETKKDFALNQFPKILYTPTDTCESIFICSRLRYSSQIIHAETKKYNYTEQEIMTRSCRARKNVDNDVSTRQRYQLYNL